VEPGPYFRKHLYFELPHAVTCNYVELVRDLIAVKLDDPGAEALATELEEHADEAAARIGRPDHDLRREHTEVEFERETDKLGAAIQHSFEYWELITNPIVAVEPKPGEEEKRKKQLELARRATAANRAMFGDDTLEFMRMSYPDRFRVILAVLRTLRDDQQLLELIHEPVRIRVQYLVEDYEQQLTEHLRERDESRGLGLHRAALRWALTVYASNIGELADRWSEESCARVNASLMPFVDFVTRMKVQH
jgi:hypothetical protein